jgi:RNA polymerase sigma-70 factor (ECF subfamily)
LTEILSHIRLFEKKTSAAASKNALLVGQEYWKHVKGGQAMLAEGEMVLGQQPERVTEGIADSEEKLWGRAALNGDLSAFDALVNRHWRKVASVVGRLLSDPNDVEDAVQETFVRAFEHLRGFRGEASVQTWLLCIAINVCKNKRGSFWRRRVTLTDDDAALHAEPADARALAEANLLQCEWKHVLRRALRQLPDKFRVPIILHFYEDLSGAEIAAVLGWNESTVWTRIYAGCRKLRERLRSDFEE